MIDIPADVFQVLPSIELACLPENTAPKQTDSTEAICLRVKLGLVFTLMHHFHLHGIS